jgi:hypothetical protein
MHDMLVGDDVAIRRHDEPAAVPDAFVWLGGLRHD